MMNKEIKAVVFDLDGTLIDTEKYYRVNWPKTFEHFGYKMSDEEYLSIRSLGRPFIKERLMQISGDKNFNYDEVVSFRSKLMNDSIKNNGLQTKYGAEDILKFLNEKQIICAIATASPKERAENYLRTTGILKYFNTIISARNMKEGKPSPDVYEYACKELNFKPSECLAVEDSPNGVISAFRAGLKVVMIPEFTAPDAELRKMLFAVKENLSLIKELFQ